MPVGLAPAAPFCQGAFQRGFGYGAEFVETKTWYCNAGEFDASCVPLMFNVGVSDVIAGDEDSTLRRMSSSLTHR
jgi:hypothetical protein